MLFLFRRWLAVKIFGAASVAFVLIAAVLISCNSPSQEPRSTPDTLCSYVRANLPDMECVSTLAEDLLDPGSYVRLPPINRNNLKVPTRSGTLFSASCYVAPDKIAALHTTAATRHAITVPSIEFEANQTLKADAALDIPNLKNTKIEIGSNWSQVHKITLDIPRAWILTFDENEIAETMSSCAFKAACIDRLLDKNNDYKLIASAVVAEGVKYVLKDKDGNVISAKGGAEANAFKVTLNNGSVSRDSDQTATQKAETPVILAVRFVPDSVLKRNPVCSADVLYDVDAEATVTIAGAGGAGNIGVARSAAAKLGSRARISAKGTEQSACAPDYELKRSASEAEAMISSDDKRSLKLRYALKANGGRYSTADSCADDKLVGPHPQETSVSSSVELVGKIHTIVRTDRTHRFTINYATLPPNSSIRVLDPAAQPVRLLRPVPGGDFTSVELSSVSGSGSAIFETRDSGDYRVEVSSRFRDNANGQGVIDVEKGGEVFISQMTN